LSQNSLKHLGACLAAPVVRRTLGVAEPVQHGPMRFARARLYCALAHPLAYLAHQHPRLSSSCLGFTNCKQKDLS